MQLTFINRSNDVKKTNIKVKYQYAETVTKRHISYKEIKDSETLTYITAVV
jgi:hypothetical protein